MAEISYRFTELYFAGQDGNWDHVKYHSEKIDLALRLALERRPKRDLGAAWKRQGRLSMHMG